MKTILQTGTKEFIVTELTKATKDKEGKTIYTKPEDGFGPTKGYVKEIEFYESVNAGWGKETETFVKINLSVSDIKQLHAKILEIEAKQFEEYIDD